MDAAARGEDPKGLIRDQARNENVALTNDPGKMRDGMDLDQMRAAPIQSLSLVEVPFRTGQPPEIRRAFEEPMGLR